MMFYSVFLVISLLLTARYVMHIYHFWKGWEATSPNSTSEFHSDEELVSVIVAARNEEIGIKQCARSILQNTYSNFELIVVDNHSTDSTMEILNSIDDDRLNILSNTNGYKKESLEVAITKAKGSVLLFTDADCLVSSDWIREMTLPLRRSTSDFVLGPVAIKEYDSMLSKFQALDMMAMMGITAGGLKNKSTYLANGANLAFKKSSFEQLGGYPAKHIKSGDDTMLVHEAVRQGLRLEYCKSSRAIVETFAVPTWKDLIHQRKRWASKTVSYISFKDKLIAAEVFSFIFSICLHLVLAPFTSGISLIVAMFQLIVKGFVDFWFLKKLNNFFQLRDVLNSFFVLFMIQFSMFLWSGISGLIGMKYTWKGRKIH